MSDALCPQCGLELVLHECPEALDPENHVFPKSVFPTLAEVKSFLMEKHPEWFIRRNPTKWRFGKEPAPEGRKE